MNSNPILWADYPDPDVIRVDKTYYMISTTMHVFPGGQILQSQDLVHWEHCAYMYEKLGITPAQRLEGGNIYGQGMWAASLRYHQGVFHAVFTCNDTHQSYHYSAEHVQGPWQRHTMQGFYYDPSMLFDEDDRVYMAHGNKDIYITEMEKDLSGPKEGGFRRLVLSDTGNVRLGYEGTHFYKIGGRYYLFCIHWPNDGFARRTEVCFSAKALTEEFIGGTIVDDDLGFFNMGVAQGGVVDTPDGQWFLMLFQDHGAVGRIPVLAPMTWIDAFPHVDKIPHEIDLTETVPSGHRYKPLYTSDCLRGMPLSPLWQWNHEPNLSLVSVSENGLRLTTERVVRHLDEANNTLTQRTFGPVCQAEVTVDASALKPGDYAGLCALQGCFCQLAITRDADGLYLSIISRQAEQQEYRIQPSCEPICERVRLGWDKPQATFKARFDFRNMEDTVTFYYRQQEEWIPIGPPHALVYRLDFFMGCRIGLFCYATKHQGGSSLFSDFQYTVLDSKKQIPENKNGCESKN